MSYRKLNGLILFAALFSGCAMTNVEIASAKFKAGERFEVHDRNAYMIFSDNASKLAYRGYGNETNLYYVVNSETMGNGLCLYVNQRNAHYELVKAQTLSDWETTTWRFLFNSYMIQSATNHLTGEFDRQHSLFWGLLEW